MRVIHVCKNCEHKTNKDKCPYFEIFDGALPDKGICKSFKKPKEVKK